MNDDGFPDVVFTGSPCYIYWGSAKGFTRRTELDLRAFGVTVGDFNQDGYLDLAFSTWSNDPRVNNEGVVVWGTATTAGRSLTTFLPW